MSKISKLSILLLSVLLFSFCWHNDDVIIRIENLNVEQTFDIPLKPQKGWVTKSISVIQNTANDTVKLGPTTLLPPGWTGLLYMNDEYNVEPSSVTYKPYKPTTGIVVLRYRVSK